MIIGAMSSCDGNRVFERNESFENKVWLLDSVPEFTFTISDKNVPYNIYFNVRNTVSYPYSNLYITYTLEDSLGNQLAKELVNYELFTRKTGLPLGESSIGDIYDHQFKLKDNYYFEHRGKFSIKFQHYMRMDTLKNVLSVGTRIEKSNEVESKE